MAWCPKCRNEYIEGFTICKECNEPLVTSLEEYDKSLLDKKLNIQTEEAIDDMSENDSNDTDREEEASLTKQTQVYVKKEDRYKDMLSSAYTLLIVGFGGLIILLLIVTDILNLHLPSPGKYVTYSGMAILLVIFVVIGIHSLNASKRLAKEADSENQLTDDILGWFNKNITPDLIENGITEDMADEIQYFKRVDNIKEIIGKAYGELNEDYLDHLSENIYQDKF
ncbi:MAG: hypothetical protein ACERKZ_11570 [Lachnotalea sp.]